ncbi:MAG TPA: C_GCAxxG_C_C family protein [Clostridiales bacterium]|nr:C_GCAxxG_C_C family protein [Clostridiales bacterium]
MNYQEKSRELFRQGYNCSQAVFGAFADKMNIDKDIAFKISGPLGGGLARRREMCGAVIGMLMVYGFFHGNAIAENQEEKARVYNESRALIREFERIWGTCYCNKLMGVEEDLDSVVTVGARTFEYYASRPCEKCVMSAAKIVEEMVING